ncbi:MULTISPECIES: isochorismate lyase [unclassified Nodularia (in: cyanobacteria)]|uniref:isochorismate lyase n=1 Tax=unclassified Nodularia (in: cyanobacteria) TaxID=2656917 RepID=UPI00187FF83A|nr:MULTISPECIES: isochorismate lyase [unclassified Nodularia (in: cyanobacteria)]MBE9198590.1 isochorismate lyase [Nodularia sp. LEGE 06071]MCC2691841.1 isochorismate lyase [Nodularia sp. LEGE 04288]
MKAAAECADMQEIRIEIDRIDHEIITAFGQRFEYVKAAAKFKTNETSVKAPERFNAMLQQRRLWAEASGLNPDVIENLYRDLVSYFIDEELKNWRSK